MENIILHLGGRSKLVLTAKEMEDNWSKGNIFLIKGKCIYQIMYSQAQKSYYTQKLFTAGGSLLGRGRFMMVKAKFANDLIGANLLVD